MQDLALRVQGVSKKFVLGSRSSGNFRDWWNNIGDKKADQHYLALSDVSFEVARGEILGIVGKNGAGKSTLLKILSRITKPSTGKIEIFGRLISLLEVGTGFHPDLTGRENVFLNGTILGMKRHEISRKFDEIIAFSGVEQFVDTQVKSYSSGMYMRLAFAVAAHLEPEILIIDEVLAVGDAEFQNRCLVKMREVSSSGNTVLFVSHNMAAVQNFCTKGLLLASGKVLFQGTANETVSKYLTVEKDSVEVDLTSRKDRVGTRELELCRIYLKDIQGNVIQGVNTGQTFDIFIEYKVQKTDPAYNYHVGIALNSINNVPLFVHHNNLTSDALGKVDAYKCFIIRIEEFPLVQGTYSLSCNIKLFGQFVDYIQNAFTLNVYDGKWSENNYNPPSEHGVCLIKGRWRMGS